MYRVRRTQRSQRLYLNFYNDGERIKNHMVEFMTENGSVTKTLFGIELGSICKTPNRGRTKLVVETYPDIFEVADDMIHLKSGAVGEQTSNPITVSTPSQSLPMGNIPMSPTNSQLSLPQQQDAQTSSMVSQQLSHHPEISQQSSQMINQQQLPIIPPVSPMASQQLSIPTSETMTSEPIFGFSSGFIPPVMTAQQQTCNTRQPSINSPLPESAPKEWIEQRQISPFTSTESPDSGAQFAAVQNVLRSSPVAPSQLAGPNCFEDMGQSPFFVYPPNFVQYPVQQYYSQPLPGSIPVQNVIGEGKSASPSPSEKQVLDVLSQNGGCMEVSELVLALGIDPQDSMEQWKLYKLLSESELIGIDDNEIYIIDSPQQQDSFVNEPTMEDLPDQSYLPSSKQPQHVDDQKVEDPTIPSQETTHPVQPPFGVPVQGANPQNVQVDTIHVQNLNIDTVNLHLHVNDADSAQISELLKLKSMVQEMLLNVASSSA